MKQNTSQFASMMFMQQLPASLFFGHKGFDDEAIYVSHLFKNHILEKKIEI